ncbi:hypothetical protein [Methylobacterium tardum]|nr:hypothetical protein [Methylobacterium tardum]URD39474.1 hypothetical protein M6G65_14315 [Methylobacterium tardum]
MADWLDDPEDGRSPPFAEQSWMRLYILAGLIGSGTLGVIGGMLHVFPC